MQLSPFSVSCYFGPAGANCAELHTTLSLHIGRRRGPEGFSGLAALRLQMNYAVPIQSVRLRVRNGMVRLERVQSLPSAFHPDPHSDGSRIAHVDEQKKPT